MIKIFLAIVLLLSLSPISLFAKQSEAEVVAKDFQKFWTEFRPAIKANDKENVASMTNFPFKSRGGSDSDTIKTHTKESFLKIWDQMLKSDPGLSAEADTMRRFVDRKETITAKDVGSGKGSVRIGDFVFEKIQGKWLFTMAFLED